MVRPLTVSGLIDKRRELVARLEVARSEIKTLVTGIDALDTALKLFGADASNAKRMRLPPAHPALKGEFQRAALDLFRETGGPISSRMVAMRFCEHRGLTLDDAAFRTVRYRASTSLCNMRKARMVRRVGPKGADARWELTDGFDLSRSRWSSILLDDLSNSETPTTQPPAVANSR